MLKSISFASFWGMIIAFQTFNACAEGPGRFFAKDIAKCFYCDEPYAISPGLSIKTPNMKNLRSNTDKQSKKDTLRSEIVQSAIPKNAPEPFKNLVMAYEMGDMKKAKKFAKEWLSYQKKILRRTKDLEKIINAVKKEAGKREEAE